MLGRWADFLMRFRWLVLAVYLVVTVVLLQQASQITFAFSFRQFFPDDNPVVDYYNGVLEEFGEDDTSFLMAVESPKIFTRDFLLRYRSFHDEVRKSDGIVEVDSIINATRPRWADDSLYIDELFDTIPDDEETIKERQTYLLNSELYRGSFISLDGSAIMLVAKMDPARNDEQQRVPIINALLKVMDSFTQDTGVKVLMGGVPRSRVGYADIMTVDTTNMTKYAALVVLGILIFTFWNWAGVLFSMIVVLLAMLAPVGTMAFLGIPISLLSTITPVIIMITGVANSIHFHTRYYEELNRGLSKEEAIRQATSHLSIALFITSVTTCVGFSILGFTDIRILAEFGLFTAMGVLCAYLITITLLPAVLAVLPKPKPAMLTRYFKGGSQRMLDFVHMATIKHPRWSVGLCLAVGLIAAGFASQVERNQKIQDDLEEDHWIIATQRYFESKLGAVLQLDIVLETGKRNGVKAPEAMRFAEKIKEHLQDYEAIGKVYSGSDLIKELAQTINDGDPAYYKIPDSKNAIAQYLLLYSMTDRDPMKGLVGKRYDRMRVSARIKDIYAIEARALYKELDAWLQDNAPPGVTPHLTGLSPVAHMINSYIVDQIFWTFIYALFIISILLVFQFRSLSIGLMSLVPNMFPLTVLLGMIGMLHINLKPSSAITFSIALGIAVDDTVHYITRYMDEFRRNPDPDEATRRTLAGTGKAMVLTTVVLSCGFLVPIFVSDVRGNNEFGILSVAAVLTALLADLFVLPVLLPRLMVWRKRRSEK